jgi:beta-lactam-binding protein with PASTA domain
MDLQTRVLRVGKLLLLAGALVATFFGSAAISMRLALKAREVQVPALINHTASEATALAAKMGLNVNVDEARRFDARIAAGRVAAQEPAAGSVTRRDRTVRLWISSGATAATVPALVGESQRTAELRLAQAGLAESDVAEIRSTLYPSDVVVAQDPPADAAAAGVALLVNRGDLGATYVMPDLIGVDGQRVAEILRDRGFRVALVGTAPYPGVQAGTVIRQSPQAGFQIGPGEPIALEVSR